MRSRRALKSSRDPGTLAALGCNLDRSVSNDELSDMSAIIQRLTNDALTLPDKERALLAQTLLRSLEPVTEEGVEAAWTVEVARRLERVRESSAQGRPAEEVFRDLPERHEQ